MISYLKGNDYRSVGNEYSILFINTIENNLLNIKNMNSIKSTLEKFGVKQKKSGSKRFYELPPLAGNVINKLDSKRNYSYGY